MIFIQMIPDEIWNCERPKAYVAAAAVLDEKSLVAKGLGGFINRPKVNGLLAFIDTVGQDEALTHRKAIKRLYGSGFGIADCLSLSNVGHNANEPEAEGSQCSKTEPRPILGAKLTAAESIRHMLRKKEK